MTQVPVSPSLLLDSDLPATAKLVWMALRLSTGAGPAELEATTELTRHTVLRAVPRAERYRTASGGVWARVAAALLAERAVEAPAKVLYGLLHGTPDFRGGN